MKLREAWALARDLDSLEAGVLLAAALGLERSQLYQQPERVLTPAEADSFQSWVRERQAGWPVAYLTGRREFYGQDFAVEPGVLIPRPETELLVEVALDWPKPAAQVAELGVGSGAVLLTLARLRPTWGFTGTDLSKEALRVAQKNAASLGLSERVRFWAGDLGEPLRRIGWSGDLLIMNPPYLRTDELPAAGPGGEPWGALDGGPDGLGFYRRLAVEAPALLKPGGQLLVEIGAGQAEAVTALFRSRGGSVDCFRDLAGWDRVLRWRPLC